MPTQQSPVANPREGLAPVGRQGAVIATIRTAEQSAHAQALLRAIREDIRTKGLTLRIPEAAALIESTIDSASKAGLANILAHHHFQSHQFEQALVFCRLWQKHDPESTVAAKAVVSVLIRLRRWNEAIAQLRELVISHPGDFEIHAYLCNALARLGHAIDARKHGTYALTLKDASATAPAVNLSDVPVVPFDPGAPTRNIIAFSLFGSNRRYHRGALANVETARTIYPSWTCRFYVDQTVPRPLLRQLRSEGAQLKLVTGLPDSKFGTFWRFLVADDATIDRFLVRDCDSVVNPRERDAVEEWISSPRHFHVMRDYFTHTELILAGLWGGVRGSLPPTINAVREFGSRTTNKRTLDQQFLREMLWPTIRQSVLVHDSQFSFGNRRDFPRDSQLPDGTHVGYARY